SVYNTDGTQTDKATISTAGLLIAAKDGQVKVVATAVDGSNVKGEATISISGQNVIITVPVTSIAVTGANGANAITSKGGTLLMSADVLPANAINKTVTWSVYNTDGTQSDKATISTAGLLTAVKDGEVKVVATAVDGSNVTGEATIKISGQNQDQTTTPDTPSSSTPTGTTQPKNQQQQPITSADLKNVLDGKATVSLSKGKTEAMLPVNVAQTITTPVEVKSEGVSLVIPSAVIKQLTSNLQGNADNAQIIVRIKTDSNDKASLVGANYKINNQIYNFDLLLVDKDGKESKLNAFSEPIQLVFPYDGNRTDAELAGVYVFDDKAQTWEYIGGKMDTGLKTISASAPHFSKYAVLEYNKTFTDVPSTHWAYRTLKVMAAKHIVNGVSATEFNPVGLTTRAEFVTMLVKTLGLKAGKAITRFNDVQASDWYASSVAAAYEAGLISGISESKFAPGDQITREQMAILIVRAYEYAKGANSPTIDHLALLKDHDQVSSWAAAGVNKAIEIGLMKGQSTDVFAPQSYAVRAETAQAILNMLTQIEK
ncbi:S-layer homology domain-containing protein, partial [Paenibacillus sp. N3.4]|uniref:S-layer homology domain-containing protein n=1 Tax=Paenibacillus sp. N3.4 TaxID=2603222 RepID=UPI0011D3A9A6